MKRTSPQNRALHLYFRHLADELNNAGYDMKETLSPDVDIPWTEQNCKWIFQRTAKAMYGKEHTSELEPQEVSEVYEVINRTIAERTGVHVPFPAVEKRYEYPEMDENTNADKF